MAERILVIEDDTTIRLTLRDILERMGFSVDLAEDGSEGIAAWRAHDYALVMLDLRLPDIHGLDVLKSIRDSDPTALVIVMTAHAEVRTAVTSLKSGAYDYLNKPFELDDLREAVRRAMETRALRLEIERLRVAVPAPETIEGMIGAGPRFVALVETTRRIAAAGRVPVLIRGESGTGKERVARAIHALSPRASGPLVTLNCSAIAEGLLESEMFGHERGAFTDAKSARRGLLELADRGTLFLDEIGDLAPSLQPKLLRVLETQTFRRVGGQKEIAVDVRFVAATNRNLEVMVAQGGFREDLYYRLNVGSIDVPPLRDRREDIPALASFLLAEGARNLGLRPPALEAEVIELLQGYAWPGNVRELRNVIERALILSGGNAIAAQQLPREISAGTQARVAQAEALGGAPAAPPAGGEDQAAVLPLCEVEKRHIRAALQACAGNKSQAANLLGISRLTLRTKIAKYGWDEYLEAPPGSS